MSGINPNRYPKDYTGIATTNLVAGEVVNLDNRRVRVFAPRNSPFFKSSMVIKDLSTGRTLTGSQFRCFHLNAPASAFAGQEIFTMVAITDQAVGSQLSIDYQTVGADYVQSFDSILNMIGALTADTRPASWGNILERADLFAPTQHLHPIGETMGWEYLAFSLQNLALAITLGDDVKKDSILQYIDAMLANSAAAVQSQINSTSEFGRHIADTNNPHGITPEDLGLANLRNYAIATAQQAMEGVRTDLYVTVDVLQAAIRNVVNSGMDAHIGRTDNPHGTTAAQLGLGNVQNYPAATAADLDNPNPAQPKYVTNVTLGNWLTGWLNAKSQAYAASLASISQQLTALSTAATTATAQAQTATSAAQTATANTSQAVSLAQAALDQAQANAAAVTESESAAAAAIQAYVAQAVAAADAAGYSRGFADASAT